MNFFECIHTGGIAQLSYLIGDDSAGVAAVVDPRADVEVYLDLARTKQVAITHIFETHIHADFVSGARELSARTGSAKLFLSHEGDAHYDVDHEAIHDGDTFRFGSTRITVRHTPGHTPEHLAYLLAEHEHPDVPWGVLSGDSLFVNSAGRPDLLGSDQAKKLAKQLFHTLREFYLTLDDGVIVYPGHGAGSPYIVGAGIGVLSWLTFYVSDKAIGASSFYTNLAGFFGKIIAPRRTKSLDYFKANPPQVGWGFVCVIAFIWSSRYLRSSGESQRKGNVREDTPALMRLKIS